MGTWGHRLYDNDTSLDVKDQFEEELHRGKTVEDITHLIHHNNTQLSSLH